jgi:hypothetical protein
MPVCKCWRCTESVPDGKAVSLSTFRRHRQQPLQPSSSRTARKFQCFCSSYPSGHYFRTKGAYNYHRRALTALERESRDQQLDVEMDLSIDNISSASIQAEDHEQQGIENENEMIFSGDNITPDEPCEEGIENENEMIFSGDNITPDESCEEGFDSDNEDISPNIQLIERILDGMSDVSEIDSGSLLLSFLSCYY